MAWSALGYDENTGKVRWFQDGQEQFLDPGQDPNVGVAADPFGWNPNAAMPTGGWSAGALLQPNYGPTLDMNNQAAVAAALRDVAPNYTPVTNANGTINLNDQVDPLTEQRAPASDFELIPSLIFGGLTAALGGGFGMEGGGLFGELSRAVGNFTDPSGIASTTASGVNPTQVAGTSFVEGVTPGLDLGANNLWSGAYEAAGNPALVGEAMGAGAAPWWSGLPGTAGMGAAGAGLGALTPGGGSAATGASAAGGGAAGGVAGTAGGGAMAGAGSALSRILDGTATDSDWMSLLGTAGSTALGLYGSNQQSQAYKDLAQKYMDFGAPSRARFEASMSPGFDVNSIPGYKGAVDTASESILRKLSATGGNPYGNPGGLIEANKAIISGTALPAYNEYARLNANTGFGSSMNAAIPFQTAAINSDANSLNAIGSGIASLTTPKTSLQDLLKQFQGQNYGMSLT